MAKYYANIYMKICLINLLIYIKARFHFFIPKYLCDKHTFR